MSEPRSPDVRCVVRQVTPSLESVPYATVRVGFINNGPEAIEVDAYDVVWPEGRFPVTKSKIALAPGESRDFTVRVPVSAGNIDTLVVNEARIERLVTRPTTGGRSRGRGPTRSGRE